MSIDRLVSAMAGAFVFISLGLGAETSPIFHSAYWLWFTAFVGANLLQASFTGFCPAAIIFNKLGAKPGVAFDWSNYENKEQRLPRGAFLFFLTVSSRPADPQRTFVDV